MLELSRTEGLASTGTFPGDQDIPTDAFVPEGVDSAWSSLHQAHHQACIFEGLDDPLVDDQVLKRIANHWPTLETQCIAAGTPS